VVVKSGDTIKPTFDSCANESMARSISAASMKRLLRKLYLITPAAIFLDDDSKKLSVELANAHPRR
jgi:hypothetical protein